jgi:hypothetical protein
LGVISEAGTLKKFCCEKAVLIENKQQVNITIKKYGRYVLMRFIEFINWLLKQPFAVIVEQLSRCTAIFMQKHLQTSQNLTQKLF